MRALFSCNQERAVKVREYGASLDKAIVLLSLTSKNASATSALIDEHETTFGLNGKYRKQTRRTGQGRGGS